MNGPLTAPPGQLKLLMCSKRQFSDMCAKQDNWYVLRISETNSIWVVFVFLLFWSYNYHPQRSCRKAMFSQACVKNSVHREGVCPIACWDTHPPGRHTPLSRHPLQQQLQSTVRILLVCIIVR